MESGEGIERQQSRGSDSSSIHAWNPVKELKVAREVLKFEPFPYQWNPVKELKGNALSAIEALGSHLVESGEGIESRSWLPLPFSPAQSGIR